MTTIATAIISEDEHPTSPKPRQAIADHPPLPTADELAGPMLTTIFELHTLNCLAWNLEFVHDAGVSVDELASQPIRLLDDVVKLIGAAVNACTLPRDRSVDVEGTLRRVVVAVAEADGLRETIYAQRASDLYHGGVPS